MSPKAFDLLVHLCERRGELVTKDVLLEQVWGRTHITEGVIKNAVGELRRVLGDDAARPRFIETVHRRGYRFCVPPGSPLPALTGAAQDVSRETVIVGRECELADLQRDLTDVLAGRGRTVFVGGEAGIGKTALIECFVARHAGATRKVNGQCTEQLGATEPLLPMLEAINELTRRAGGECVQTLRKYAPTWLAKLPWHQDDSERGIRPGLSDPGEKARMLRELCEFFRAWTETEPVLLVIEDLHWADCATLDAIAFLARCCASSRLMLLGSYRSDLAVADARSFRTLRARLQMHGSVRDVQLGALAPHDVGAFLSACAGIPAPAGALVDAVFRRTQGHPLFLAALRDEEGFHAGEAGCGYARKAPPRRMQYLVEAELDRLDESERQLLDAAALCDEYFEPALIATLVGRPLLIVADWCEKQARSRHLLRARADVPGTYAFRYGFVRVLMRQRIALARREATRIRISEWAHAARGTAQAR